MPLRTSMALLLAVFTIAVLVVAPRRTQVETSNLDAPAHPVPSPLGQSTISLEMAEKLGKGFKKVYDLAEVPNLFTLSQVQLASTKPGESATGVVVLEQSGQLYLDSTPCEPDWNMKQVFSFNRPYTKGDAEDKLCENPPKTYKTSKVTKR